MRTLYLQQSNLFTNNLKILVVISTAVVNLKTGIYLFNNLILYMSQVFTIAWDCKRHTECKVVCHKPTQVNRLEIGH